MFRPTDLNNGQGNNDKGFMDYVKEYWAMVPMYNRALLILLPTLYLISWIAPIHIYSVNVLAATVYQYECKLNIGYNFLLTSNTCLICAL